MSIAEELPQKRKKQSFVLYWPASWYENEGRTLGFTFSAQDFERAKATDGVLGRKRFLPTRRATTNLPFPPGSYVECRLIGAGAAGSISDADQDEKELLAKEPATSLDDL